ncbi:MAG: DNA photolyase [Pseudomonadota bacterium]
MISMIYIEREIALHPRTQKICAQFPKAQHVLIDRYTEVFNPKNQNFRAQKENPALILAYKHEHHVLAVPESYGLGASAHYYFSHLLNCPYDCRYCFLQGMYSSAHYVFFVNLEDFNEAIRAKIHQAPNQEQWFFSGYDSDSLAFEPVTCFAQTCIPLFEEYPNAYLELRTKSTQIRSLTHRMPLKNVIIAYSLNPDAIAKALEHKAPSLEKRLQAMESLQEHGWRLGLRFDPLIWHQDYQHHYQTMIEMVFKRLRPEAIHSVTLGTFRLPKTFYKNIVRLYPKEALLSAGLEEYNSTITYEKNIETQMLHFCKQVIEHYIAPEHLFQYSSSLTSLETSAAYA